MTGMLTGVLADLAALGGPAVPGRLRLLAALIGGPNTSGITFTQAPRLAPLIPLGPLACAVGIPASIRSRPGTAGACGGLSRLG
jgi:hypothetical protein